jgi:hypothetical protein
VWNVSLSAGCPPRISLCSPSGVPNRAAYPAICCLVSSLSVVPAGTASTLTSTQSQIPWTNVNDVPLEGSTGYEGTQSVVHLSARSDAVFADIRSDGVVDHAT